MVEFGAYSALEFSYLSALLFLDQILLAWPTVGYFRKSAKHRKAADAPIWRPEGLQKVCLWGIPKICLQALFSHTPVPVSSKKLAVE